MTDQMNCLHTLLREYRGQITAASLRKQDTPLCRELRRCYDMLMVPAAGCIASKYVYAVLLGLVNWGEQPLRIARSADMNDEIMGIFADAMDDLVPKLLRSDMKKSAQETARALSTQIAADMTERGFQPLTPDTLDMHTFQQFWLRRTKEEATGEVMQKVEEFEFWELLDDLPQIPEEFRIRYRARHVESLFRPVTKVLEADQKQLENWLSAFFQEEKFLTVFRNQIILSLEKWARGLESSGCA